MEWKYVSKDSKMYGYFLFSVPYGATEYPHEKNTFITTMVSCAMMFPAIARAIRNHIIANKAFELYCSFKINVSISTAGYGPEVRKTLDLINSPIVRHYWPIEIKMSSSDGTSISVASNGVDCTSIVPNPSALDFVVSAAANDLSKMTAAFNASKPDAASKPRKLKKTKKPKMQPKPKSW